MYVLKDAVVYSHNNKETIVQLGKSRWKILDTERKFYSYLEKGCIPSTSEDDTFFNFLIGEGLLTKNKVYPRDRLIKNRFYFENISKETDNSYQEAICKKKVLIIGLGGIGTVVLYNLVAMGVKTFYLFDGDVVDESNLNRQLYFEKNDISKSKVSVIKDKLARFDNTIEVKIYKKYINTIDDINKISQYDIDLLVNAADTPINLNTLLLSNHSLDMITGGVGLFSGYYTAVIASKYRKDALNFFREKEYEQYYSILKGSISPTNMLIGTMMANEILKFWINDSVCIPSVQYYDFYENTTESEIMMHENRN